MADTAPQQGAPAWDRHTDPIRAWTRLRQQASTDEQRACIAAATRQADRVWIALHNGQLGPATATVPPRDAGWYRLALSAFEVLTASAAYRHLARHQPWACAAAEPIIASWLSQPAGQPIGQTAATTSGATSVTMAQRLGIDDEIWPINADTQLDHLSTLVNVAQDAHVFGVPGHRIGLVRDAHHHNGATVVRLVVDAPRGPALASDPLHLAVLIDPDSRGIDAATAALRRVADIVTDMFISQARAVWNMPPPMPVDNRADTPTGRAFPELRLDQQAAPALSPTPAPAPHVPPRGATPDSGDTGRTR
ncbi:MAG: hypothetical protein QOE61_4237 [Micromonosporaceae bacterium]|jgi:hypothetical protein|nr:hypothetical protein [Micromonosporaceae bacterium]